MLSDIKISNDNKLIFPTKQPLRNCISFHPFYQLIKQSASMEHYNNAYSISLYNEPVILRLGVQEDSHFKMSQHF